jgi:8-amino-7-oxononanoate synthase
MNGVARWSIDPLALLKKPDYRRLQAAFARAEQEGITHPYFASHDGTAGATTILHGRSCINFANYNYLGMSGDPRVAAAACEAITRYGTSVSASRLIAGERPIHTQLETTLADFLGTEAALTLVSGHATNVTVIGHLVGARDLVLHDALAHNSIIEGCRLAGAQRRTFPHNDAEACDALLRRDRAKFRRVLIAIEGLYSMDGDLADLPRFVELRERYDAALLVDEAHSLGTTGKSGRGVAEHYGISPDQVDIWMGTLSKTLGSCGGYIAGGQELINYLKFTMPGFVFSVGMSPPNAAAALAALQILRQEPELVRRLLQRARLFWELAQAAGIDTGLSSGTPIVPIMLGDANRTLLLAERLLARGICSAPILPPAVSEKATRLRFFISTNHTPDDIQASISALVEELTVVKKLTCAA